MKVNRIYALLMLIVIPIFAHHFKGLPHFSYFENYPQIPQEEFLGQNGDYEYSLVLYDFQGLKQMQMDQPNDARLFLIIFNMRENAVYKEKARLEILDKGNPIVFKESEPEEENVFSIFHPLPSTGKYSLRITLLNKDEVVTDIPFVLSSQKIQWGKWIALTLLFLIVVAGIGSRRTRIIKDRKMYMKTHQKGNINE